MELNHKNRPIFNSTCPNVTNVMHTSKSLAVRVILGIPSPNLATPFMSQRRFGIFKIYFINSPLSIAIFEFTPEWNTLRRVVSTAFCMSVRTYVRSVGRAWPKARFDDQDLASFIGHSLEQRVRWANDCPSKTDPSTSTAIGGLHSERI